MKPTVDPPGASSAPGPCWRGECRNGCYYADACNLEHTRETFALGAEWALGDGEESPEAECPGICGKHHWLDRPESDTRECLICGAEVAG